MVFLSCIFTLYQNTEVSHEFFHKLHRLISLINPDVQPTSQRNATPPHQRHALTSFTKQHLDTPEAIASKSFPHATQSKPIASQLVHISNVDNSKSEQDDNRAQSNSSLENIPLVLNSSSGVSNATSSVQNKSVFTYYCGGRLGNIMCIYAHLYLLGQEPNVEVIYRYQIQMDNSKISC